MRENDILALLTVSFLGACAVMLSLPSPSAAGPAGQAAPAPAKPAAAPLPETAASARPEPRRVRVVYPDYRS
ncbi:hypothetical protein U8607_14950 [Methylobacterium durans]|uniref:hypothetical protein n=1 Tax=Methylobacterium durans TaxID=2202825 RepID=UPI0018823041|nr:hypothetical protein [Methylobacterium durans]MEA1833381.1 hypothetical protein [Methylobacterium durans]